MPSAELRILLILAENRPARSERRGPATIAANFRTVAAHESPPTSPEISFIIHLAVSVARVSGPYKRKGPIRNRELDALVGTSVKERFGVNNNCRNVEGRTVAVDFMMLWLRRLSSPAPNSLYSGNIIA